MSDSFTWTSRLIRAFFDQGVRHAVISPGSRSTPITLALANHPGFEKHIVLDERSAAFMALGIGKASGIPALLVCTSGTAAANYFPAVIEAKESGTPMVVLSADRPPHLRGTGSSQTIDQIKLYGDQAVFFHEAGEPAAGKEDLNRLCTAADQAVYEAIHKGGAAHINLPFRKPLEPSNEDIRLETVLNVEQTNANKPAAAASTGEITPGSLLKERIKQSKRPLIIAGPANPHQALTDFITHLTQNNEIPLLSEPGSQMVSGSTGITGYEQFLRNGGVRNRLKPDLIIRTGDTLFTKSILTALEEWDDVPMIHFIGRDARQGDYPNESRVVVPVGFRVQTNDLSPKPENGWMDHWKTCSYGADASLNQILKNEHALTDAHVFRHFSENLTEQWQLMLSNSFPVRDMAMFGKSSAPVSIHVNRGAAGIDGISSTALGLNVSAAKNTLCMIGDLAFLHDSNALLSAKLANEKVVLVVINNGGGTIFRMLPVHNQPHYTEYFETPHFVDYEKLSAAHSVPFQRVSSAAELQSINLNALPSGLSVIECVTDAGASMNVRRAGWNFTDHATV
jgi:2-succinyl-5-enolpyruvyl-6-hydroxy-3-cyclohexene-1-carboxylate synthase